MSKDEQFKVLQKKEVYDFLSGSSPFRIIHNGTEYGMPHCTGGDLIGICSDFGYTGFVTSPRWAIVEGLLNFAIEQGRCDELLRFFFSQERFDNLRNLEKKEIDPVYQALCSEGINYLNYCIMMTKKELSCYKGHFYIVDVGQAPEIETPVLHKFDVPYVRELQERCREDFLTGQYDSVITKSRTMMEEIIVQILDENGHADYPKGKIIDQYNIVKSIYGLQQSGDRDARVNMLVNALERIVQSISDLRNANSDAHGVGRRRYRIRDYEARLVMNSAITFCEYILAVRESRHTSEAQ